MGKLRIAEIEITNLRGIANQKVPLHKYTDEHGGFDCVQAYLGLGKEFPLGCNLQFSQVLVNIPAYSCQTSEEGTFLRISKINPPHTGWKVTYE